MVCAECGVTSVQSRSGRWVHVDEVPKGFEVHDARPQDPSEYAVTNATYVTLRQAASDMMQHHGTLHPETACPWADRLREALRRS